MIDRYWTWLNLVLFTITCSFISNVNNSTTVSPAEDIHHPKIAQKEIFKNGYDHISKPVKKAFGNNVIEKGIDIVAKYQLASFKIGC